MIVFCPSCGHRNPIGVKFCSSCGASLANVAANTTAAFIPEDPSTEIAADDLLREMGEVPAGTGVLIEKSGPDAGTKHYLTTAVVTVGRHPESDVFLDDVTVSRRHAEFFSSENRFKVRDVGSLNGTYVNRERIEEVALETGDEVQIGKFKLLFVAARVR